MEGILQTIISIPNLLTSLGCVCGLAILASPVMYNGDYKKPIRAVFVLGCCSFFTWYLLYSCDEAKTGDWKLPTVIGIITNISFILGLYIGIFIHNFVKRSKRIACLKK